MIDSILRDYDVPKMYLHKKKGAQGDLFDVIDGQQRIRTIWPFYDDEFALAKDADPVNDYIIAGKKYSELPMDIASIIDSYSLDFVILDNENEDEIREMFLRLQNGTSLKAQEKRNAMPGKMRDFVREVAKHEFFSRVNFSNSRFTYDLVAAQMCMLSLNGGICNIKDKDLNGMYETYRDFDFNSANAKSIMRVLGYLNGMFPVKAPELKRYSVVSLYILIMDMLPNYDICGREQELSQWFIDFEMNRTLEEKKPPEQQDPKLVIYHERVSNSSDAQDSLIYRHEMLKESLLSTVPNLAYKDSKRNFDEAQRQVIYRRDKGICQMG